ncbi:hypothetical protein [Methylobacterium sp. 37f]|uniref:hypothetical protein n=1 Tax=Methylobacterium sp. 37f TaxID=2817058 RepID=UPI001FFCFF05|nr:hypothetical protein [Methylobacterium sp. 37f]MCK2055302.1 hypothetical protein [Methylobacterium sp. 37f]
MNVDYVQAVTRRGTVYCGATIDAHEIEIGESTGTTMLNGQPVSKHRLTVHLSSVIRFVMLSKSAVTFIQTGRFDDDTGYDLLQYLDASGNPTSEFVRADTGAWNYAAPKVVQVGAYPIRVTVNNLLTAQYDASGVASQTVFNVLDLAGAFVRTGTFPPGYSAVGGYGMIHLVNADVLLTPIQWFKSGYASYDLGTTWIPMTGWGPRGSDPNKAPYNAARPPGQPPENTDLLANQPLFYT